MTKWIQSNYCHVYLFFSLCYRIKHTWRLFKMWIPFFIYIFIACQMHGHYASCPSNPAYKVPPKSKKKKKNKCKWGRCERQEAVGSLVHVFHSQHHRHRGARDHSKVGDYQIHEIGRRHIVRQVEEAERGHILPTFQVGLSCTAHDEVVRVIWEKINTHGEFILDENKIKTIHASKQNSERHISFFHT